MSENNSLPKCMGTCWFWEQVFYQDDPDMEYEKCYDYCHKKHHAVSKKTCLWLKNLPKLQPTNIVEPEIIHSAGKSGGYSGASWHAVDENGKILAWNDPRTATIRSKTYWGIAEAMASQWGCYNIE